MFLKDTCTTIYSISPEKEKNTTLPLFSLDIRITSLIFEAEDGGENKDDSLLKQAQDVLMEECMSLEDGVLPQSPERFMMLVRLMKKLSITNLQKLYKDAEVGHHGDRAVRIVTEALPLVQTEASIQFMVNKLIAKGVAEKMRPHWLYSIFFLKSPTKEILAALKPLIVETATHKPCQTSLLSVAAVVNEFCTRGSGPRPEKCTDTREVTDIIDVYVARLNSRCSFRNDAERNSVFVGILETCPLKMSLAVLLPRIYSIGVSHFAE